MLWCVPPHRSTCDVLFLTPHHLPRTLRLRSLDYSGRTIYDLVLSSPNPTWFVLQMDLAAELPSCSDTDELPVAKETPADAPDFAALFPRLPRRRLRRAAEREHAACHGVDAARWQAEYPPPSAVPLDAEGFAVGFPCPASPEAAVAGSAAEAVDFYRTHGYVVFAGALSAEECAASRAEIWDALEAATPGVRRGELASYSLLSSATYGLAPVPAVFSRQLLANRQSPRVVAALAALLGADVRLSSRPRDGLLVSHDRWCFYRPTAAHPEWRTRENLHLDLHPWSFRAVTPPHREALETLTFESLRDFSCENNWVASASGPHLQGVVALSDNADADGGTQLVPGFPARFDAWADALGDVARHSDAAARCSPCR